MKYAFLLAPAPVYDYIGCMKRLVNSAVVMLILVISGCYEGPYEADFTTEKPAQIDVVGLYQLKQINYSDVISYKISKSSSIRLNNDGTYEANEIPNVFSSEFSKQPKEITTKGTWKLDSVGAVNNFWGQEKIHWGITMTNFNEDYGPFGFMGSSAPYELIYTFDDPSLGFAIIFQKSE